MAAQSSIFDKIPCDKIAEFPLYQRWLVVVLVQVVFFVAYYFIFHSSLAEEMEQANKKHSSLQQEIGKLERISRKMPLLKNEIKGMEGQLKEARGNLPDEKEIPKLLQDISAIGRKMGLQFLSFVPLPEAIENYYSRVPVSIEIHGSFHSIVKFFDLISKMERIVTISNVQISKPQTKNGKTTVKATCMATTFRYIESVPDDPKKKKKK